MLEVLDTRLLSVLTWYHLSFLAVSVAMLGMAAGAVLVFVGGDSSASERACGCCRGGAWLRARAAAVARRQPRHSVPAVRDPARRPSSRRSASRRSC